MSRVVVATSQKIKLKRAWAIASIVVSVCRYAPQGLIFVMAASETSPAKKAAGWVEPVVWSLAFVAGMVIALRAKKA